ncbi:hypothetical protein BJ508DRAFT_411791 [Ascobolus immersus RN42]|uniref:Uncharacterized protein n=1 Tax=Ascobolus immersus RN42 TaxID=1160509 RepID=A0A3N4IW22_ASCIM|nr:hypothetical protein BJ508DRAFT_411791 [Ascobolus immersus RN42]
MNHGRPSRSKHDKLALQKEVLAASSFRQPAVYSNEWSAKDIEEYFRRTHSQVNLTLDQGRVGRYEAADPYRRARAAVKRKAPEPIEPSPPYTSIGTGSFEDLRRAEATQQHRETLTKWQTDRVNQYLDDQVDYWQHKRMYELDCRTGKHPAATLFGDSLSKQDVAEYVVEPWNYWGLQPAVLTEDKVGLLKPIGRNGVNYVYESK